MHRTATPYQTIRAVSALLGVPTSTLRYWETVFPQLSPIRTKSGQRRYSTADVELAEYIRMLLHDKGLKIESAREVVASQYKHPPKSHYICESKEDAYNLLREVTNMVNDNLHIISRLDAVENWLISL